MGDIRKRRPDRSVSLSSIRAAGFGLIERTAMSVSLIFKGELHSGGTVVAQNYWLSCYDTGVYIHKIDGDINNKRNKNNILVYYIVNNGVYHQKHNTCISLICNQ